MSITTIPWVLAGVNAVWFGLMARRAQGNWVLWALGGGVFALVTSTIIFGLGQASCIPFSDHERAVLHTQWTLLSIVVTAALGWLFTWGLHRHRILTTRESSPPANPPPATAPKI